MNIQFEVERKKIIHRAVTLGALLCTIIVPLFCGLDLAFKPHLFWPFAIIRLVTTLIAVMIYILSKRAIGQKNPYLLTSMLAFAVCGSISLMCHLDMGPSDPYYAGINLPLLGIGIMVPLTVGEGGFLLTSIWLSYFIPSLFLLDKSDSGIFANNNFFLLSTIIISMVGSRFQLVNRKQIWQTNRRLQSANHKIKNHAHELEGKVNERTQRLLQSERLAVVGQLAGGIAHDFNNILTAILGVTHLLLQSLPKKSNIREDITSIERAGNRAADLVKQLLAFSRRQILSPKFLNINDTICDVGKMLQRLIGENIELEVTTDPRLGYTMADPIQIEQIILNLAVNARDAMYHGGKLMIETKNIYLDKSYCSMGKVTLSPGEYILLAVSDTGKGMSEDIKSKIFEPFFTTKKPGSGTGLGMSTVYGIIKQSHGDILVYSEPNKGTTLKIYLPRVQTKKRIKNQISHKPAPLRKGKETILLVEDEKEVRSLTARMLKRQGYKVIQAEEGRAALAKMKNYKGSIDLLVTDVIMPHMNGQDLAKHLVKLQSRMKVLFISGHIDSMIAHQGLDTPEKP
jgi:signal transduction histidine kinase/CheY-like chemotaxis protein